MYEIRVPRELFGLDSVLVENTGTDQYGNTTGKIQAPSFYIRFVTVPTKSRHRSAYNFFAWATRGKTRVYIYDNEDNPCVESTVQVGPFKAYFGDDEFLGDIQTNDSEGLNWDNTKEFQEATELLKKDHGGMSTVMIFLDLIDKLELWDRTWKREEPAR